MQESEIFRYNKTGSHGVHELQNASDEENYTCYEAAESFQAQ